MKCLYICLIVVLAGCDLTPSSSEEGGFREVWRFEHDNVGVVHMPPIVLSSGDLIANTGAELTRFDQSTGEQRWSVPATANGYPFQTESASVVDGVLLTHHASDTDGFQHLAFRTSDGKQVLARSAALEFNVVENNDRSASTSDLYLLPTVDIQAIRRSDFSLAWEGPSVLQTPSTISTHYADGRAFAVVYDLWTNRDEVWGAVVALDAATGDSLWTYVQTHARPVAPLAIGEGAHRGLVFASFMSTIDPSRSFAVALKATTGEIVWKAESPIAAEFAYHNGALYGFSGELFSLDADTGRLRWQTNRLSSAGEELVVRDGFVYAVDAYQLLILDASTGELVHEELPVGGYWWNIAQTEDHIIVQSAGAVVAFEPWGN